MQDSRHHVLFYFKLQNTCTSKVCDLQIADFLLVISIVVVREWEKEVHRSGQQGKDPSFLLAIIKSFGLGYSMLGLVALIHVS